MPEIYVGFGSNVEPERHLNAAIRGLEEAFGSLNASSVYRNPPVGFSGADFLNLVVGFVSGLPPLSIQTTLTGLEATAGRVRNAPRLSSRALDLDLLLYGSMVDSDRKLPRPDVLRYAFVLSPLAELAPDLRHPVTGRLIGDAWQEMAHTNPPLENLGEVASFLRPGSQN